MYKKGLSAATIGLFLASILAIINPAAAVTPPPENYELQEYAWLKEEGVGADTWAMYNNTGWNRLNCSYKFSKVNMAYVVRDAAAAGYINATFIVYRNISAANGFYMNGTLFDGSTPVWNRTVETTFTQSAGLYTYHLFITTFDPMGQPGIYQVRINETGPGSGSSWTDPAGTVVEWMFFHIPTAAPDVMVTDQLGRGQPFYLDGDSPSTIFNATMLVDPPGNDTGATTAIFEWLNPDGTLIEQDTGPIYYIPGEGWAAQNVIAANTTAFPFNATDAYTVRVTMGSYVRAGTFYVLSTQWIAVDIDVEPLYDQWFDPSSFKVTFTAQVNTGVDDNPYQDVYNLTLQFWNMTHYQGSSLSWVGNPLPYDGMLANMSWNITGYPVVDGSSYTYVKTVMIPTSWISTDPEGLDEFFGWYKIKSIPTIDPMMFPATQAEKAFYVDDPIEGYISIEKASTTAYSVFEQKTATIWVNAEFDPTYLRTRQNDNAEYDDKDVNISWYWQTHPNTVAYVPNPNDQTTMTQNSWPSEQFWAFSTEEINGSLPWPIGTYEVIVNATADSGYIVRELITYNVVYKTMYLEIWPKWMEDPYAPCMKKSIVGKTYYLDEDENQVPVDWGFYVYKIVDPNGVVYSEPLNGFDMWGEGCMNPFPWTFTETTMSGEEALGAVWDELPSDAEPGTWTVYAMVLYADWQDDDVQAVDMYSYQGPSTCTFEVAGEDVHLMIDDILMAIEDGNEVTWEMLNEVLGHLSDLGEDVDGIAIHLDEMETDVMAKLTSIEDYAKEIKALTSRLDRWRTDWAEEVADHFTAVMQQLQTVNNDINNNINSKNNLAAERAQSLSTEITAARAAISSSIVDSVSQIINKLDTVNAGLSDKLTNVLNAVYSEVGGLDDSMKAELSAQIEYAISSMREKVDQSHAGLSSKIASAADGLHAKFSGVMSEIGYVGEKVDAVHEKLGGVEQNVKDEVSAVDASVGTKLLVAIILIVIVLILCLLPIVAPGFRMKE